MQYTTNLLEQIDLKTPIDHLLVIGQSVVGMNGTCEDAEPRTLRMPILLERYTSCSHIGLFGKIKQRCCASGCCIWQLKAKNTVDPR